MGAQVLMNSPTPFPLSPAIRAVIEKVGIVGHPLEKVGQCGCSCASQAELTTLAISVNGEEIGTRVTW